MSLATLCNTNFNRDRTAVTITVKRNIMSTNVTNRYYSSGVYRACIIVIAIQSYSTNKSFPSSTSPTPPNRRLTATPLSQAPCIIIMCRTIYVYSDKFRFELFQLSIILFRVCSPESPRSVTRWTGGRCVESEGCLTSVRDAASSSRVCLVDLWKLFQRQLRSRRTRGAKFRHTLCLSIMSFAIQAGGPVSRTGFPTFGAVSSSAF